MDRRRRRRYWPGIGTSMVIFITSLNVIVYKLHLWGEKDGENNNSSSLGEGWCCCFSLAEVQLATRSFDNALVIGRGGFGKVYKGVIGDEDTIVALKRLNWGWGQGGAELWIEIETLSKIKHTHLATLIGYCDVVPEMVLGYEYMSRDTLVDHLYKIDRP
ncbi:probable receptor-like protein kinase At5g38990 [Actinidia eriantha]|uniref:probable receptor-like protein kinase At5g38990 n=1 Tax=Actinidia eriantha TaxID=165200 RepID=UPI0025834418|nr:probable receptor-like protein kinase At5g38990 [Actinidia eriantha]